VCGLELAAMAGFFVAARAAGLTILLDGYVASSAALIAERLSPGVAHSMIAAHLSREPGHRRVLDRLGLVPFLEWDLCLGEGNRGTFAFGLCGRGRRHDRAHGDARQPRSLQPPQRMTKTTQKLKKRE